jgi:hypothetical protein
MPGGREGAQLLALEALPSSRALHNLEHGCTTQGRDALAKQDWKAAEKALIDALWVDQTASAVNAKSWIDLCKVRVLMNLE